MGGQWVCVTYGGTMGDIWGGTMGVRVRETCTSASEYMFCFVFSNMYPFSPYVTPHSPHIPEFDSFLTRSSSRLASAKSPAVAAARSRHQSPTRPPTSTSRSKRCALAPNRHRRTTRLATSTT